MNRINVEERLISSLEDAKGKREAARSGVGKESVDFWDGFITSLTNALVELKAPKK